MATTLIEILLHINMYGNDHTPNDEGPIVAHHYLVLSYDDLMMIL